MLANVFISFDHDDLQQVAGFKLLKNNPKHPLDFQDHSLKDAVRDRSGKPIKYPRRIRDQSRYAIRLKGNSTLRPSWLY